MEKIYLIGFLLIFAIHAKGQIKAVTETGDEVILYENGEWNYVNDTIFEESEMKLNEIKFFKGESSTFLVKSKKVNIGIWINPKEWSFSKAPANEVSEYKFQSTEEDMYRMLIAE